ncbi:MAG: NADH-dependent [FeFe] hydrogenase, group A6 [bacterium]
MEAKQELKTPEIQILDRTPYSTRVALFDESEKKQKITVTINGVEVTVNHGTMILEAAKKAGIHIPTLCHHPDLTFAGVCRICVVEIEGQRVLQASCSYPITVPMNIKTFSPKVRQARRHILDLLLSKHYGECYSCFRNENCELQALANEYGVDFFRFGHPVQPLYDKDYSSYAVNRDPNKCILCRRCVRTCIDLQEVGTLEVEGRGVNSRVTTFGNKPLSEVVCINCGQCINRCPTGALYANDPTDEVWDAIDDPTKHVVIQTAPSPRAAIGECFGMPPGTPMTFKLNTALRRAGFDKVFDTNFAADLTIIEEGTELLTRLYRKLVKGEEDVRIPMFTSCSPGWVKYLEHFYPSYVDNLSTCKSPQQMFGTLIKTFYAQMHNIDPADIVCVSLMPCAAKKYECNRPEMHSSGYKDVDFGLTTREAAAMLSEAGIKLGEMPESDFNDPFGTATGSGVIFGATGGVMEAALRAVIELVTGDKIESLFDHADIIPVRGFEGTRVVEYTFNKVGPVPELLQRIVPNWNWLKGVTLSVGVAHGTANAHRVMRSIEEGGEFKKCHFIEFMACPGGCLGGGGQPIPTTPEIRAARARAIYAEDKAYTIRKSHENPAVVKIYDEFLTEGPNGHLSHELLHTHYTPRGKYIE